RPAEREHPARGDRDERRGEDGLEAREFCRQPPTHAVRQRKRACDRDEHGREAQRGVTEPGGEQRRVAAPGQGFPALQEDEPETEYRRERKREDTRRDETPSGERPQPCEPLAFTDSQGREGHAAPLL